MIVGSRHSRRKFLQTAAGLREPGSSTGKKKKPSTKKWGTKKSYPGLVVIPYMPEF
ncbi:hypothetical protein BH10PLA2_BH10PLA2_21830 [soil metagenome]